MLHSDKLSRKRACTSPVKHIPIKQQTLAFRRDMMGRFQPWAMKTYGDSAKTKTVTRKKQSRISKILRGEESKTPENTKFCSWVKAKGFCIGPPPGHPKEGKGCDQILYVPACTVKDENGKERPVYKKVAIVEDFFDIIYDVHVETEGKHGKHAGQKRTYRAISEKYAFLPREAVTKFLLQCTDCQRRGTVGSDISRSSSQSPQEPRKFDFDFNMPITTTYLKRMRSMGYSDEETLYSEEAGLRGAEGKENNPHPGLIPEDAPLHPDWTGYQALGLKKQGIIGDQAKSPVLLGRGQNESVPMDDTSSNGAKDEDDDMDDDDSDDKIDTQHYDPERLKAFNMFVRLFVDENLDRIVPISKQPKEKIQAIIDSCNRQFPEFCERARKRIRTYLKSCRRNKRTREQNGMELSRPTPPHLTSIQAEQILAQACENESQNAKRMRMGLDPVSQPMPSVPNNNPSSTEKPPSDKVHVPVPQDRVKTEPTAERVPPTTTPSPVPSINSKGDQSPFPPDHFATLNGHSPSPFALYKTNFAQTFHKNNNNNSGMGPESLIAGLHGSRMSNGSELNLKRGHKPNLSTSEIAAVRQLIIGYRESAAFLLRSADELEQLLISQR